MSTSKPPAPQVAVNNAAYFLRPTGGLAGGEEGRPVSDTTMEESSTGEGQKEKCSLVPRPSASRARIAYS